MSILAIDAGNSRIKWGLHDTGGWLAQDHVPTVRPRGLAVAWAKLPRPDRIVASSVAGAAVARALAVAARPLRRPLRFVTSRARQCGVVSAYERPARLGPDRWAALIGARHLYHGPCVVVNAGTTVTVDALTGEGVFLGGMIVPGVELMRRALARGTARLGLEPGRTAYFPSCTADAITSGAVHALAGAVERMHRFMREAGESAPLVVVSGGAAGLIAAELTVTAEVVENLVLEGLVCIAASRER